MIFWTYTDTYCHTGLDLINNYFCEMIFLVCTIHHRLSSFTNNAFRHVFCGDYIFSGHTMTLVLNILKLNNNVSVAVVIGVMI